MLSLQEQGYVRWGKSGGRGNGAGHGGSSADDVKVACLRCLQARPCSPYSAEGTTSGKIDENVMLITQEAVDEPASYRASFIMQVRLAPPKTSRRINTPQMTTFFSLTKAELLEGELLAEIVRDGALAAEPTVTGPTG